MIVVPNNGSSSDAPRLPPEPESGGTSLVRFGDVLAAVQLRREPDAAAEATSHVADVFNANGFFARGMTSTPTLSAAPSIQAEIPHGGNATSLQAPPPLGTPSKPPAVVDAGGVATDWADAASVTQSAVASSATAFRTLGIAPRRPVSPPFTPTAGQVGMPVSAATPGVPVRTNASGAASTSRAHLAQRALPRSAPQAASDAPQVVVRAGEGVVEVIARVDRLGARATATLRARIAAMLSRHGFSGGVVRLIGGNAATRG